MIRVIPSRHHLRDDGLKASVYGACPWLNDNERDRWTVVTNGWTWWDDMTNTVGMGRAPVATQAEAETLASGWNARREADRAEHVAFWQPINAPVEWVRSRGNDGAVSYHSGEAWAIRKIHTGARIIYVPDDGTDLNNQPQSSTLAGAKEWTARRIRVARTDARVAEMETA
jgi:hypothetical protein